MTTNISKNLKKVSEVVADFFAERGIKHIFGIVGAGNAHLFDAFGAKGTTEIVCVHHEQAACMAAITYFRTSSVVTTALVTTGGGSTNAITGVVNAWMDSMPLVVIAGNENSKFTGDSNPLRIWGVQGYDSVAMVQKVTKYATRVCDPQQVVFELAKAFEIASSGRPGPVWIEIPMNIQAALVEYNALESYDRCSDNAKLEILPENRFTGKIDEVLEKLSEKNRPILWLGHGVRLAGATQQIPKLLERLKIPTLVSWSGIDMIDSDHPLVFGRAGVYGQRAANFVLQNCDFILAIGTRLAIPQIGYELSEFARDAEIASVDIDYDELTKHGDRITIPICMDAGEFVISMLQKITEQEVKLPSYTAWQERCDGYRTRYPSIGPEHADEAPYINSYKFMYRLNRYFKPGQVVVTDMGTALLSGHQVLNFSGDQRLMTSTGLGEMGFGLPGAIGASFALGKGEIICLNCDGGMMMNLQELQTIVHHRLPIKIFIFNNDGYLMIKHTQEALFKGHKVGTDASSGVSCPDFSALGVAFGFETYQIRTWDEFEQVIPLVQSHKGPVICEVFMHPQQKFVPKLAVAPRQDGSLVSPPLEDLSPLLKRDELLSNMINGLHPKSVGI